MRSAFIYLPANLSELDICAHLDESTVKLADERWVYPNDAARSLYISVLSDYADEFEPCDLEAARRGLQSELGVVLMVDASGRLHDAYSVIVPFLLRFLAEFGGCVQDDYGPGVWSSEELRDDMASGKRRFFSPATR